LPEKKRNKIIDQLIKEVVNKEKEGQKANIIHPVFGPDVLIINPEYALQCIPEENGYFYNPAKPISYGTNKL